MDTATDQIARLLADYCHRLDDGDIDGVVALFSENATLTFADRKFSHDQLARFFSRIREARAGRHMCSNLAVDVNGDTAHGLSDYVFIGLDGENPQVGRYEDIFGRIDGGWRIASRSIRPAEADHATGR